MSEKIKHAITGKYILVSACIAGLLMGVLSFLFQFFIEQAAYDASFMYVRSFMVWSVLLYFLLHFVQTKKGKELAAPLSLACATILYVSLDEFFGDHNPEIVLDAFKWLLLAILVGVLIGLATSLEGNKNTWLEACSKSCAPAIVLGYALTEMIFINNHSLYSSIQNIIVLVILAIVLWFVSTEKEWHNPKILLTIFPWTLVFCAIFSYAFLIQFVGI